MDSLIANSDVLQTTFNVENQSMLSQYKPFQKYGKISSFFFTKWDRNMDVHKILGLTIAVCSTN